VAAQGKFRGPDFPPLNFELTICPGSSQPCGQPGPADRPRNHGLARTARFHILCGCVDVRNAQWKLNGSLTNQWPRDGAAINFGEAMTTDRKAWGIKLCGHEFDLEYWRDTLKEPFDPAVVQQGDVFILHASEFQSCDSAPAVLEKAIPLFDVLNGAMRTATGAQPVRYCGIYELRADSWRESSHVFPPSPITDLRAKLNMDPVIPAPPPTRSNVQVWMEISEKSDHLADALIYFGRGEWFDVYKAVECLEAFAGGGDSDLRLKKWIEPASLILLKRTANCFHRHRRGAFEPPKDPMTLEQARRMLAKLIECAFAELG
jgi:hypothetical protein